MDNEQLMTLFGEINSLLSELDEVSDDLSYLENLKNVEQVLAIAFLARGVIRGDLEISTVSIENLQGTKAVLEDLLNGLGEEGEDGL
jgi:hypothetical protein